MGHRFVCAAQRSRTTRHALGPFQTLTPAPKQAVDETSKLKALEVLGLLMAGALFVWWQFRDLAREKKKSKDKRQQAAAEQDTSVSQAGGDPMKTQDPRT